MSFLMLHSAYGTYRSLHVVLVYVKNSLDLGRESAFLSSCSVSLLSRSAVQPWQEGHSLPSFVGTQSDAVLRHRHE
jgi:hypothetical protein